MNQSIEMRRITYIDTAKGLGIFIVTLGHIVPEILNVAPIIYCFWIPLFFTLSGIFFRDTESPKRFVLKKTRSLVIPFTGWYIISYSVFGLLKILKGKSLYEVFNRFFDVFTTNDILNIPLWFLLALFWSNIFLYFAKYILKSNRYTAISVLIISIVGINLYRFSIPNFLYIGSAMSNLPYLFFGYIIAPILLRGGNQHKNKNLTVLLFAAFLCIGIIISIIDDEPPRLVYYNNTVAAGNPLSIYLCGSSLVLSVILLSKLLGHLPLIIWLGKNSLIILVSHLLIAPFTGTILQMLWKTDCLLYIEMVNLIVVLSMMVVVVPLCNRFLPFICAQKK